MKARLGGAVTIWDSAPPALARLVNFLPQTATDSPLRLVMMSGDWIPVGLPGQLMRVFPQVKVKSLGGATEAAILRGSRPLPEQVGSRRPTQRIS